MTNVHISVRALHSLANGWTHDEQVPKSIPLDRAACGYSGGREWSRYPQWAAFDFNKTGKLTHDWPDCPTCLKLLDEALADPATREGDCDGGAMTARPSTLDVADFLHAFGRKAVAGVDTACGVHIGREQDGRGSPRYTWMPESVTCPCCLAGVRWPTRDGGAR